MSIRTRIEDAENLWAFRRREGAWVMALIAAAATSRKRYPRDEKTKKPNDKEAFTAFIRDVSGIILTGKTQYDRRGMNPIEVKLGPDKLEDVIYKQLRNNLVHEGQLRDVQLSKAKFTDESEGCILRVSEDGQHIIPEFWVLNLIEAVKGAQENRDLFTEPEAPPGRRPHRPRG